MPDKFKMPNGREITITAVSDAQGRRLISQGGEVVAEQKEQEYEEPTNEQLANFLIVIAPRIVGAENLLLDKDMLTRLLENPMYRTAALRKHKAFVEEAARQFTKMARGQLQCEYIRTNDRRCPNFNEPGSFFCGLHKPDEALAENTSP